MLYRSAFMADAAAPEITGNVLFYNTPEPLNSERHAKLGCDGAHRPGARRRWKSIELHCHLPF